ncbi:MAG: hypothetical protein HRU03_04080 [Nanoarchaeales archaeon]|nr:hypothetical protein [Nanoarchaeales archaeon]
MDEDSKIISKYENVKHKTALRKLYFMWEDKGGFLKDEIKEELGKMSKEKFEIIFKDYLKCEIFYKMNTMPIKFGFESDFLEYVELIIKLEEIKIKKKKAGENSVLKYFKTD